MDQRLIKFWKQFHKKQTETNINNINSHIHQNETGDLQTTAMTLMKVIHQIFLKSGKEREGERETPVQSTRYWHWPLSPFLPRRTQNRTFLPAEGHNPSDI